INGNSDRNLLRGDGGNDTLRSRGGNDVLDGGTGRNRLIGGSGDDIYIVRSRGDVVVEQAGQGTDIVKAVVSWRLGNHQENLTLLGGRAALNGSGNTLDNQMIGNLGDNLLLGGGGNDILRGGGGNDRLFGNIADDLLQGGGGDDVLIGGGGNDRLEGGNGNDRLEGSIGNNVLIGGDGDDILIGGPGRNTLTGGAGRDRFYLNNINHRADAITDFDDDIDQLYISRSGFRLQNSSRGVLSPEQFRLGSVARNESDRFLYNRSTGQLFFDADGSGRGDRILVARLSNNAQLSHSDIVLF
ncbi:MAG TPA: calcium-binding protein, partial [Candidatus Obscuribacterales bacterium]